MSFLGMGGSSPKVSTAPIVETKTASEDAAKKRAKLYATEGQASGAELSDDGVQKRKNLLGN
jgi:hypothetical protein